MSEEQNEMGAQYTKWRVYRTVDSRDDYNVGSTLDKDDPVYVAKNKARGDRVSSPSLAGLVNGAWQFEYEHWTSQSETIHMNSVTIVWNFDTEDAYTKISRWGDFEQTAGEIPLTAEERIELLRASHVESKKVYDEFKAKEVEAKQNE